MTRDDLLPLIQLLVIWGDLLPLIQLPLLWGDLLPPDDDHPIDKGEEKSALLNRRYQGVEHLRHSDFFLFSWFFS